MAILYLTAEQAIKVHSKTVEFSGGGHVGLKDFELLESILGHIQNDVYYPTLEEKLAHLFFSICKYHCFTDGNKRLAITICAQMLLLNGYMYCVSSFMRDMENISYHVATSKIDKILLRDIIAAFLNGNEENEELKLRILEAITQPDELS